MWLEEEDGGGGTRIVLHYCKDYDDDVAREQVKTIRGSHHQHPSHAGDETHPSNLFGSQKTDLRCCSSVTRVRRQAGVGRGMIPAPSNDSSWSEDVGRNLAVAVGVYRILLKIKSMSWGETDD